MIKQTIPLENIKKLLSQLKLESYNIDYIEEGVSTEVFKLNNGESTLYLRILPPGELVTVQKSVHDLLLSKGVKVSSVLESKDNEELLNNQSFLIETEIKGLPVNTIDPKDERLIAKVLYSAGRDLAKINCIKVVGLGKITNVIDGEFVSDLRADNTDTLTDEIFEIINEFEKSSVISKPQSEKLKTFIERNAHLSFINKNGYLNHADFNIKHIFQNNGDYTGIIDFGDVKGGSKFSDIAHFYLYNPEYLEYLLKGYEEVSPLPQNKMEILQYEAIIDGIIELNWVYTYVTKEVSGYPILKLIDNL